eukprot:TRINITY_DN3005_c0_g1_i1.p1 TRINITY_DN3005_c0_g1~~TRINITY_DN3005_c0_g1_i1.p1  ORF type:complete len:413 (+),score=109.96 TRINITY_DN3005_c0_g1_i1:117-1241(+)
MAAPMRNSRRSLAKVRSLVAAACVGALTKHGSRCLPFCGGAWRGAGSVTRSPPAAMRWSDVDLPDAPAVPSRALGGEEGLELPSEKQIAYANRLASEQGKQVPPEALSSKRLCSEYIEERLRAAERPIGKYPPTEKQLQFVRDLAARQGMVELPQEVELDSSVCSEFIDKLRSGHASPSTDSFGGSSGSAGGPSEKQLAFAETLAERAGVELSEALRSDRRGLSNFIDEQLKVLGPLDSKPSEKSVAYASRLAEHNGVELPPAVLESQRACSNFIDTHKTESGTMPPSEKQWAFAERIAAATGDTIPADAEKDSKALSRWIDSQLAKTNGVLPPSERALAFAQQLAEMHEEKLPEAVRKDAKECSKYIDAKKTF